MVNSNSKGNRREREFVNVMAGVHDRSPFDRDDWAVLRAPASGSATERELPDVLFGNGVDFYATEVKASSGDPIYLDEAEVDALVFFAGNFGAKARIVTRFDRDTTFYLVNPKHCHVTPAGNYRVKHETAEERGMPHDAL